MIKFGYEGNVMHVFIFALEPVLHLLVFLVRFLRDLLEMHTIVDTSITNSKTAAVPPAS